MSGGTSVYDSLGPMDLREELSDHVLKGRKACVALHGMIRKTKFVQAMLQMKKDKAKQELDDYVNRLSECLVEFRSQMLVTIETKLQEQLSEASMLKTGYEEDIETLSRLCDQTEKMVQFDRCITTYMDRQDAYKLLNAFSVMLDTKAEDCEVSKLMKFEFTPSLSYQEITCDIFGELSLTTTNECKESILKKCTVGQKDDVTLTETVIKKQLTSSDCSEYKQPLKMFTQSTQTEDILPDKNNNSAPPAIYNTYPQTQQHCPPGPVHQRMQYVPVPCPQVSPGYVRVPYPPYGQPVPVQGLSLYTGGNIPTNVPVAISPMGVPYNNLVSQPPGFAGNSQQYNPINYQTSYLAPSVNSLPFKVSYPACTSNMPVFTTSSTSNSPNCQTFTTNLLQNQQNTRINTDTKLESTDYSNPDCENKVKEIPLPIGPMPLTKNTKNNYEQESVETISEGTTCSVLEIDKQANCETENKESTKKEKTVGDVNKEKSLTELEDSIDEEDNHIKTEKNDDPELKSENQKVFNPLHSVPKKFDFCQVKKTENLLSRCKGMLNESDKETLRSDETTEFQMDPSSAKKSFQKKNLSDFISPLQQEASIVGSGPSFVVKINDCKLSVNSSPVKPLRRPLRLPKMSTINSKHATSILKEEVRELQSACDKTLSNSVSVSSTTTSSIVEVEKSHENITRIIEDSTAKRYTPQGQVPDKNKCNVDSSEDHVDSGGKSVKKQMTLREYIKKNYKPTPTEMNREQLQAQTNWCKGYLNKTLNDAKDKGKDKISKEDWETETKTDSNTGDIKMNISVAEDNNGKSSDTSVDKEDEIQETETPIHPKDIPKPKDEILNEPSVEDSPKLENDDSANPDLNNNEKVLEKETEVMTNDNVTSSPKVKTTDNITSAPFASLTIDEAEKDKENGDGDSNKVSATTQSKPVDNEKQNIVGTKSPLKQTRNFKQCFKNILSENKDANESRSKTSRLGAIQAHWLQNISGTNVPAKLLFKISKNLHFPIGVMTNSEGMIIVTDTGNNTLKMYKPDGTGVVEFGANMKRPSAVVINEFDDIFVKDDLCIRVFDKQGRYIQDIGTQELFSRPYGLVMTPGKCLMVLDTDRRQPALVHMSQDGKKVWRFPYTPLINAPQGSKCRFMASSDNSVIVSDLGLSQIYITNFEGMFRQTIGCFGHGRCEFNEPSGVTVDIYGNMVIGDSKNNRVQVFRHDGSYIGLVEFDDGIVRPSGIHLTSDNKLLVVNFLHHSLKVYQL